jgi:hypothetical protein
MVRICEYAPAAYRVERLKEGKRGSNCRCLSLVAGRRRESAEKTKYDDRKKNAGSLPIYSLYDIA